ncbi:hypothetical protein [Streptomyces sp. NPDC059166]|uniref:hypothetical protein n=1 Tax=Streptomyces sp. NPDC059166 TaxID=3346752 RepID=UPI00369B866D
MSVSLYYRASRPARPTNTESAAVERIVAAHSASFPYGDEESLHLCDGDDGEPSRLLEGSTKMPFDPSRVLTVICHVLDSVTELRRALPGARWHVHLDDLEIPWDEDDGYALPGMRDTDLAAEPEGH